MIKEEKFDKLLNKKVIRIDNNLDRLLKIVESLSATVSDLFERVNEVEKVIIKLNKKISKKD